jgi:LasA protease
VISGSASPIDLVDPNGTIAITNGSANVFFSFPGMKHRVVFLILLAWLFPAFACHLPTGPDPSVKLSVQNTLVALRQQTAQAALAAGTLAPIPTLTPFPRLATAIPSIPYMSPSALTGGIFHYTTRPGDTAGALARRFGVEMDTIFPSGQQPPQAMLQPGIELAIPNHLGPVETFPLLLPDSEVVYSPAAKGFSTAEYIQSAAGYLSTHSEVIDGETFTGAQIVDRVAVETSIDPRLLLAFLQSRSGWVTGQPVNPQQIDYPIGFYAGGYRGLYKELILTARQLTIGYYGWRSGSLVELEFTGGDRLRIDPLENPATVALQYLFSKLYSLSAWKEELYQPGNFIISYAGMFPDPWVRAASVEPLLPFDMVQPSLELPFQPGQTWTLTGGPHAAWGVGSPWGAIDFAPADVEKGCTVTHYWATAAAAGLVTRSERGVVAIDLDGDGFEGTGWVLVYLHLADSERIPAGTRVQLDQQLGHPSCEGGFSTGTHVHISRKLNGEWLSAGGPYPFVLSGWQVWPGDKPYSGTLTNGDKIVTARPDGANHSLINR